MRWTFSPPSLTFTTGNWNTARPVTVYAAPDDDAVAETATLTHAVSGGDYGTVTAGQVVVTVGESDTRGATVTPTALEVRAGGSADYTVVLDSEPTDPATGTGTRSVTVTVMRSGSTDVTVMPTSLTFTTVNWETPRTVTVSALADEDGMDDTATLTHAVSGADYGTVTAASVSVTVTASGPATGKPTILGAAQVGTTLTAGTDAIDDEDGLTSVSYNYQWLRAGSVIATATSSTYTPVTADWGQKLQRAGEFPPTTRATPRC